MSPVTLCIAAVIYLVLTLTARLASDDLAKTLALSFVRMTLQLCALGLILKGVFTLTGLHWIVGIFALMTTAAAYTVCKRCEFELKTHFVPVFIGLSLSTWGMAFLAAQGTPRLDAASLIPLFGMIVGNSLTGLTLALGSIKKQLRTQGELIQTYLAFGATHFEAHRSIYVSALQTGVTPVTNAMLVAGIVSIPGMMTGQILAGEDAWVAAQYQIGIMLFITISCLLSCGLLGYVMLSKPSART